MPEAKSTDDKLLPCPFCGEPPLVAGASIWCANVSCWGPHVSQFAHVEDAIAAWNRRLVASAGDRPDPTPDAAFDAWVASLPKQSWAKYDLSACRLGWDAARRAALPTEAPELVALVSLEWESIDNTAMWANVVPFWLQYRITLRADRQKVLRSEWLGNRREDIGIFADWDAAKVAAQTDFNERLAALPVSGAPEQTIAEVARIILSVSSVPYDDANDERREMARAAAAKVIAALCPATVSSAEPVAKIDDRAAISSEQGEAPATPADVRELADRARRFALGPAFVELGFNKTISLAAEQAIMLDRAARSRRPGNG
ncbi:MAG: hypothetical protein BGO82_17100 [Devosia sp. 67-54]|nr:MAG: hypothetical protein BGO82_17100 [Devosia sp. 67-54]